MTELKQYKSHKVVHAKPMKRSDYNEYRGWEIPADENPNDDGYLVVYGLGTDDHYESWSPKKQFDEGYNTLTEHTSTWQERVTGELAELNGKIEKLEKFLNGVIPKSIPKTHVDTMKHQLQYMKNYATMLKRRLKYWGDK